MVIYRKSGILFPAISMVTLDAKAIVPVLIFWENHVY
jgi:hypothetical protein